MGFRIVEAVLHGYFPVEQSRKLVLIVLADHADARTGEAFPSHARVGRFCNLSPSQVQKIVASLVAEDWVFIEARATGRGHSNHYRLNLKRLKSEMARLAHYVKGIADNVDSPAARPQRGGRKRAAHDVLRSGNGDESTLPAAQKVTVEDAKAHCGRDESTLPTVTESGLNLLTGVESAAPGPDQGAGTSRATSTPFEKENIEPGNPPQWTDAQRRIAKLTEKLKAKPVLQ